jgi:hypothetical protein
VTWPRAPAFVTGSVPELRADADTPLCATRSE